MHQLKTVACGGESSEVAWLIKLVSLASSAVEVLLIGGLDFATCYMMARGSLGVATAMVA